MKNKTKQFIHTAIPIILIGIIMGFFVEIKTTLIVLFSLLLLIGYIVWKEKIGQELIVAIIIAIAWTSIYPYEYNTTNLVIGKINLFPLISWIFGLVLLREIYERMKSKYKLLTIWIIYIVLLIAVEYLGFHFLKIQLSSNYPGLLGFDVLHIPLWAQIYYLTAGPIYLLITNYLKVK